MNKILNSVRSLLIHSRGTRSLVIQSRVTRSLVIHSLASALFLSLAVASTARAQTIVKITGDRVNVTVSDSQAVETGQAVNFLDENLDVKAVGVIEKISPQGKSAIIRVTSGKVASGFTFEIASSKIKHVEKPLTPEQKAQLTPEERKILARGEIGSTAYTVGGILSIYPGFGIGHAVQGRFSEKGWIFLVGELGSATVFISGAMSCFGDSTYWSSSNRRCESGAMTLGALGIVGFRIWGIIDAWMAPPEHNRRYRELSTRTARSKFQPFIIPHKETALLGLNYQF